MSASRLKPDRPVDRVTYQPALDGLRGLAALAVFAVHLEQNSVVEGTVGPISLAQLCINGRHGVALFLLLTGYFLAGPLWSSPDDQRAKRALGGFWRRRIAKLIPLYWSVLLLLSAKAGMAGSGALFDLVTHALFLHNLWPETLYSISEPMWAIAVIGQYYVFFWIFTSVLAWFGCLTNRWLYLFYGGIASIGWGLNIAASSMGWLDNPDHQLVWEHGLPIHLPIFAVGALVAAFVSRIRSASEMDFAEPDAASITMTDRAGGSMLNHFWDLAASVSVIGLILVLGTSAADAMQWSGGRYGYPVIPGMLAVIVFAASRRGWTRRMFSLPPLPSLGVISYGIYLLHLPVMRIIKRAIAGSAGLGDSTILLAVVTLGITCVLAWTLTLIVDAPLRRYLLGARR